MWQEKNSATKCVGISVLKTDILKSFLRNLDSETSLKIFFCRNQMQHTPLAFQVKEFGTRFWQSIISAEFMFPIRYFGSDSVRKLYRRSVLICNVLELSMCRNSVSSVKLCVFKTRNSVFYIPFSVFFHRSTGQVYSVTRTIFYPFYAVLHPDEVSRFKFSWILATFGFEYFFWIFF